MSEKIELLHATSNKKLAQIRQDGFFFVGTCLTNSPEVAEYYIETIEDEIKEYHLDDYPVLLKVFVDIDKLGPDFNSFSEPLTFFRNEYANNEKEWHELIEVGKIPYPNVGDWKTSLDVVWSVKTKEAVSAESCEVV